MRRLPLLTPRQFERLTLAALVLLFLIILTGAGVRLTGSGLGCTNWPKCGDSVTPPLDLNAWIEFGNRIITGIVGIPCVVAFVMSFRRRPRRRDLIIVGAQYHSYEAARGQCALGGVVQQRPAAQRADVLASDALRAAARRYQAQYAHQ